MKAIPCDMILETADINWGGSFHCEHLLVSFFLFFLHLSLIYIGVALSMVNINKTAQLSLAC